MDHDDRCACRACQIIRAYLAGPEEEHPGCCVCPLCAFPRMQERLYEQVSSRAFERLKAAIHATRPLTIAPQPAEVSSAFLHALNVPVREDDPR